jgi:multicomponent Na+:H+ antiporter subunit B
MNSVILQIASKYVKWILVFFALIALYRGHNYPGGGFIGGLLVGLSVIFNSFAYDVKSTKTALKIQPERYIALGLLLILLSILPGLFQKQYFMAGVWTSIPIPLLGNLKLGTPLLFDIGIFLAIVGVTLLFFFTLNSISKWK